MKKKSDRNVSIIATNNETLTGLNIFLDFSGKREFLVFHRRNGLLYLLLKDGMPLDALRRWKPNRITAKRGLRRDNDRSKNERLEGMVSHLLKVVDSYLFERETSTEDEIWEYVPTKYDSNDAVGIVVTRKAA